MWAGAGDLFLTKRMRKSDGTLLVRFDYLKKKKMWHLSCSPCLTHSKPWSKQSQLPCAKQHYREAYKASIKENLRLVDSHMKRLEMYLLSPVKRHISKFGSKSSTVALKLFQFWLIPGLQSYPRSWPRDSQLSYPHLWPREIYKIIQVHG